MFRATMCRSSGELTASMRYLVYVTLCGRPDGPPDLQSTELLCSGGVSGEEVNMLTTDGTRTGYERMPMPVVPWPYDVH